MNLAVMDAATEQSTVQQALRCWFGDQAVAVEPLGAGHIHGTWLVTSLLVRDVRDQTGKTPQRYVLQRINQTVFTRPEALMANLLCVQHGAPATELTALPYALPTPLPALSGSYLVQSGVQRLAPAGEVPGLWRLAKYIEGSRTLQRLASSDQAEAAGRAFGEFQYWLGAQHAQHGMEFTEVIPGFHQLPGYLQALRQAVAQLDPPNPPRQRGSARERVLIDAVLSWDYGASTLEGMDAAPSLIHGDCKLNNLLFAADDDRVVAVLDLDTMMQGPWWLDFGDLVRSATCSDAGEFNAAWYPALAKGFFAGRAGPSQNKAQAQLTGAQLAAALQAPAYMTYMLCVRFLTDHLLDDPYFRVTQHGDNLRRAEAQYRLLETLASPATRNYMRGVLEELL